MKVYRLEVMVLDFDELGGDDIASIIEHTRFANRCISPTVMRWECKDIGQWRDDHPLNYSSQQREEFDKLFGQAKMDPKTFDDLLHAKHTCGNCGRETRVSTAGCDHCDLENK